MRRSNRIAVHPASNGPKAANRNQQKVFTVSSATGNSQKNQEEHHPLIIHCYSPISIRAGINYF